MGGILSAIGGLIMGNVGAKNQQSQAIQAKDTQYANNDDHIRAAQSYLDKLYASSGSNPALGDTYAPQQMGMTPQVMNEDVGSVYSGFNPGAPIGINQYGATSIAPQEFGPNAPQGFGPNAPRSNFPIGSGTPGVHDGQITNGPGPNPSFGQNAAGQYDFNGNSGDPSEATNFYDTLPQAESAWNAKYGGGAGAGGASPSPRSPQPISFGGGSGSRQRLL